MPTSNWDQFWLLLWKNWLLQRRRPLLTLLQICIPAIFAFVLLLSRAGVPANLVTEPTYWDSFRVDQSWPGGLFPVNNPGVVLKLLYAPQSSTAVRRIVSGVAQSISFYQRPILTLGKSIFSGIGDNKEVDV